MGSEKKTRSRAGSKAISPPASPSSIRSPPPPKRVLKRHGTAPVTNGPRSPTQTSIPSPTRQGSSSGAAPKLPPSPESSGNGPLTSNSLLSQMSNSTQPSILSPHGRAQKQAAADDDKRMESLWAEMQDTLDEVELNVAASRPRVFGKEHAERLEELRRAQVELAAAWGRSEGNDDYNGGHQGGGSAGVTAAAGGLIKDKNSGPEGREKKISDVPTLPAEDGPDGDMGAAKRRREANDRYFDRVNKGVKEVVKRLAVVATAMEGVEKESREVWADDESLRSTKA